MSDEPLNRRNVLRSIGVAGAGSVIASSTASAEGTGNDAYDDFTHSSNLEKDSIRNNSIQYELNPDRDEVVFTTFTSDKGMAIYLADGVEDSSEVPSTVTLVSDAPYVFAPRWVNSKTLQYWSSDGVYERRVTDERLGTAHKVNTTMQELIKETESPSTDGYSFSGCKYVSEVNREVCLDARAYTNLRRPCKCSICTGGETPPIASVPVKFKILKAGVIDVRIGGWVGFNFQGANACFWAGEPDTMNCAYECVGADGAPSPADVQDAFKPLLEPNGIDPNSETGLVAISLIIAAIVAIPGPTPV